VPGHGKSFWKLVEMRIGILVVLWGNGGRQGIKVSKEEAEEEREGAGPRAVQEETKSEEELDHERSKRRPRARRSWTTTGPGSRPMARKSEEDGPQAVLEEAKDDQELDWTIVVQQETKR